LVLQVGKYWRNVGFELEHKERKLIKVGWFSSVQYFPGKQTKFIADTMVNWEPVPNMNGANGQWCLGNNSC